MLIERLLVQHKATIANTYRLGVAKTLERNKVVGTLVAKDVATSSAVMTPSNEVKDLSTQRARTHELIRYPGGRQ